MDAFIEIIEVIQSGILILLGVPILWLAFFVARMICRKAPSVLLNLMTIACNGFGYIFFIGWSFRTRAPEKTTGYEVTFEDLSLTGDAAADEIAVLLFALSLLSILMLSLFSPHKMPFWGKCVCLSSVGLGLVIQGSWLLKFFFYYARLPHTGINAALLFVMSLYHINYIFMTAGQLRRYSQKPKNISCNPKENTVQ
ncbi:MAG: hypothetical protein IJ512_00370 [Ruminococcus sp.]|nr:hypothetical protein [Ruminococcus sp.]